MAIDGNVLEISPLDGQRGLRLVGELDIQSSRLLKEALAALQGGGQAKLDLSEVTFIDSGGLHTIVQFARSEDGNGALILEGVSPYMLRLFEITCLADDPSLEIRP